LLVSGPLLGYAARATPQFLKSSRQFFGFIIPRLENNERTENYQLTLKKRLFLEKNIAQEIFYFTESSNM